MSNFNKYAAAIGKAQSPRRINNLKLEIIQDRTLIPMEYVHLGALSGMQLCAINQRRKKVRS